MYTHQTNYRVIYGDTDQMGVVYYGNYARLYEIGRTEMLRSLGLTYKEIEAFGVFLPVISLNVKYKRSAHYDDILCIQTKIDKLPSTRIIFYTEIFNEENLLINKGETELVFLDANTQKPVKIPQEILSIFNKII